MNKSNLLLLALFLLQLEGRASHKVQELILTPYETKTLESPNTTAFYLRGEVSFSPISYQVGGQWQSLRADEHHFQDSLSALEVLPKARNTLILRNNTGQALQLHIGLISSLRKESVAKASHRHKKQDSCNMPAYLDQASWRGGLPEPAPNPQLTPSHHLIVHHSATSNNADDYTRVVRDIYTFHTEGRGWDDIGYNYLISPAGVVYAGRDGQGQATDEIKGAHFCGKNSYTMGVCLLGNYEKVEPSDSMLSSLEQLLTWKCKKERLDPRYSSFHPPGLSTSSELPHIAGHKDGCSTACPGQFVYEKLPGIREQVFQKLLDCGLNLNIESFGKENKDLFHLVNGQIVLRQNDPMQVRIYNLQGRLLERFDSNFSGHTISLEYSGIVIIEAINAEGRQRQKLWLP